jgi:hypothetical protein
MLLFHVTESLSEAVCMCSYVRKEGSAVNLLSERKIYQNGQRLVLFTVLGAGNANCSTAWELKAYLRKVLPRSA